MKEKKSLKFMLETQYQIMHCDPHVTPAYQSITLTWFCLICPNVADFKQTTSRSGKVRLMFMHWNSHYTSHTHAEKMLAQMSSFITQSSWACMQISPSHSQNESQFILKPTSVSASAPVSLPPPPLLLLCQQRSCTLVVPKKFCSSSYCIISEVIPCDVS